MECYIVSKADPSFCLDVEGGSQDNNAHVIIYKCHGGSNQQWRLESTTVRSVNSNKVLDIEGGENVGSQLIQFEENDGPNQKWYWHFDGTIRSEHGLCLEIKDGKLEECTDVVAANPIEGKLTQQWRIVQKEQ